MKIALIAHRTQLVGPLHNVETYYLQKNVSVLTVTHPLDEYKNQRTEICINSKKQKFYSRRSLGFLNYTIDMYLSITALWKYKPTVIMGFDNFDTLAGLLYKKIFRSYDCQIVYFASDFSSKRFTNSFLNSVYHWVEIHVLKSADYTISNTYRAEKERLRMGLKSGKSIVIPNCIMNLPVKSQKRYSRRDFIYIGSLTKEHGLYEFLQKIYGRIGSLLIIGDGYEKEQLISFLQSKSVHYTFVNHVDRKKLHSYLMDFKGFGLAPYTSGSSWTTYCSPLKVVEYLAYGIPVIISNIPEISDEISQDEVGIVYDYLDKHDIESKISRFSFDDFPQKAYTFSKRYYYKKLLGKLPI